MSTTAGHVTRNTDQVAAVRNGRYKPEPEEAQPLVVFDLVDLLHEEFEPLQWIIPDYLPEGLTLLFSRPKVGKSMLALALSLRMARRVSGGVDGTVLYLTLDDTSKRRLQSRTRSLLQGVEIEKGRVWAATQAQALDSGLIGQLTLWMNEHITTRLMVIDVYARIKPKKQDDDVYKSDYNAIVKLQEFAVKHHIAILLVHHTRKQRDTEDWIDNVNGSTGLSAGVDTLWTLERKPRSNNLTLKVKGRDTMGELAVGLSLDDLDAPWQLDDEEDEEKAPTAEQKIFAALQNIEEALTPKQIAELTSLKQHTSLVTLRRMLHKNLVEQTAYGRYKSHKVTKITHMDNSSNIVTLVDRVASQAGSERVTESVTRVTNDGDVTLPLLRLPTKPMPFTEVPRHQLWPTACRSHAMHRDSWMHTLTGLHCPFCEPAYGIGGNT